MNIGSAWTKTEEKDGKKIVTGISITLDDAIYESGSNFMDYE